MNRTTKCKPTGSKGFGQGKCAQGLSRCGLMSGTSGRRDGEDIRAGATSPLSSDCYRVATWNARCLNENGKLENLLKEMNRMEIDILGVGETFL